MINERFILLIKLNNDNYLVTTLVTLGDCVQTGIDVVNGKLTERWVRLGNHNQLDFTRLHVIPECILQGFQCQLNCFLLGVVGLLFELLLQKTGRCLLFDSNGNAAHATIITGRVNTEDQNAVLVIIRDHEKR